MTNQLNNKKPLTFLERLLFSGKFMLVAYQSENNIKKIELLEDELMKAKTIEEFADQAKEISQKIAKITQKMQAKISQFIDETKRYELKIEKDKTTFAAVLEMVGSIEEACKAELDLRENFIELIILFSKKEHEQSYFKIKDFLLKNEDAIFKSINQEKSSNIFYREMFDYLLNNVSLLKITKPDFYQKHYDQFAMWITWFENKKELSLYPESQVALGLFKFVNNDFEESKKHLKQMFNLTIINEIAKRKVEPHKMKTKDLIAIIEERTQKETGKSTLPFWFDPIPVEFKKLIEAVAKEEINKHLKMENKLNQALKA